MNDVTDRITARNPLLGHGPRTRTTGIALDAQLDAQQDAKVSVQAPVRWWHHLVAETAAPSVHMGPAFR